MRSIFNQKQFGLLIDSLNFFFTKVCKNKAMFIFHFFLTVNMFALTEDQSPRDINTLVERIVVKACENKVDEEKIQNLLATLDAEGFWAEIDYKDKTRGSWKTASHISRMELLAIAYRSPKSSFKGDVKLKGLLFKCLKYWAENDFKNPNWWWDMIGVPMKLGVFGLLMKADLSKEQIQQISLILKRSDLKGNPSYLTGQNLVWIARCNIYRGLLGNDRGLVKLALSLIEKEIKISTAEGVQPDFSFHQHGPLLYNHGYGAPFVEDCSSLFSLAKDTSFQFPKDKIDIVEGLILDGSQWMAYGSVLDLGANGRGITRRNLSAMYLKGAAENMQKLGTKRKSEYQALILRLTDLEATPLVGNNYFWRSDYMVHRRPGYFISTRMHSTRVLRTDGAYNGEGKKVYHIADGCNFLMQDGSEYRNIYPNWDWKKLPGTTVVQDGKYEGQPNVFGERSFVGGVSDGIYGLSFFNFSYAGLTAHKAWFCFDKEIVCLGSAIHSNHSKSVVTTLNQCFLRGPVHVIKDGKTDILNEGKNKISSPVIIHHDNVAYKIDSDSPVLNTNLTVKASWYELNTNQPKDEIIKDIFTLLIDHGVNPKDELYSYTIYPNIDIEGAKKLTEQSDIRTISNTVNLQAVRNNALGLTQAVFFKSGKIEISKDIFVEVDQPCLLMCEEIRGGFKLSVSDPLQKLKKIQVLISGKFSGSDIKYYKEKNQSAIELNLPQGLYAGRTVVKTIKK